MTPERTQAHTPGPWKYRKMDGMTGFVEAPKAKGMAYALDVCGDDYTGYGDDEQREINMQFIARAPETAAELAQCRERVKVLEEALKKIRDTEGKVCDSYQDCHHAACWSSYNSWAIAHATLAKVQP